MSKNLIYGTIKEINPTNQAFIVDVRINIEKGDYSNPTGKDKSFLLNIRAFNHLDIGQRIYIQKRDGRLRFFTMFTNEKNND